MRTLIAALVSACIVLPLRAQAATTTIPDPTDASASAPAIEVPSAFNEYASFKDGENPSWQQLNRDVAPKRNGTMQHSAPTTGAPGDVNAHQHRSETK